jgi:hypothetical protein
VKDSPSEIIGPAKPVGIADFFADKWFFPTLRDIEAFEKETEHLAPELSAAADDDSADWVFNAVWNFAVADAENSGLSLAIAKDTRSVGTLVGVKWSLCEAYERAYPFWNSLKPEQVEKLDDFWGAGFVAECIEITKEFKETHVPRFREIKKTAMSLAQDQGFQEEIDYLQGYTKGTGYLKTHFSKLRPPSHKREADRQKRACVVWFVISCGELIEKNKGDLSWPELHQLFGEFVESLPGKFGSRGVNIDEDAFVQILKRAGLKGVGKPGRRPSNETGTP